MKDDLEKYLKEEQDLLTADKKERNKILLKRIKREQRNEFFDDLPFYVLLTLFMTLLSISFGWIN